MSRDAKSKPARSAEGPPTLGWFAKLKRLRLRLRRKDGRFHVLLEDPAEHLASIKRQTAADTSEAALLRGALKAVLDKHASTRSVLVHLSVLEKALGRHGLQALDELPLEVLQPAMTQLETLVSDWSQGNLAGLRARLTDALIKHGRAKDRRRTSERLTDFQNSRQLQVNEASVTTFMEVSAQWERSLTGQKLSVPPA